jgi:hypothetical protein
VGDKSFGKKVSFCNEGCCIIYKNGELAFVFSREDEQMQIYPAEFHMRGDFLKDVGVTLGN